VHQATTLKQQLIKTMGLDQYVYTYERPEKTEIKYWRKHNAMHGWMEALWKSRGGSGDFNCIPLELHKEDLEALREAINGGELPETHGFFFGSPTHVQSEDTKAADLEFVEQALQAIEKGLVVEYNSWW
jgi:hypothetical protein